MIFNFNYSQAIKQAGQIEDVAREMRSLASGKLTTAIDTINASWDGSTSDIFIGHCNETKTQIGTRASDLDALAKRIREVAKILKEAEERARREMETKKFTV
jgi:uncharacterized protein YukE